MHIVVGNVWLVFVTQVHSEEFVPPKVGVNTVGSIKATFDSTAAWPPKITGTRDGDLVSSGEVSLNGNKVGPFTWSLKASGSDFTEPSWPPKMVGSVGSSWQTPLGKMRGSLETPVAWPMKETKATVSLRTNKDLGDFCSTLKCTALPGDFTPTLNSIKSLKLAKDVTVSGLGDFSCAVETNPDLVTTASIEQTVDTFVGPVCCKLESTTDQWPPKNPKMSGSLNMKKQLGDICCNLEMTSAGSIQCSFGAASKLTTADLAQNSNDNTGVSAVLPVPWCAAALVGSGLVFAAFHLRRGALPGSSERLLAA
jgi:hypothetical protein